MPPADPDLDLDRLSPAELKDLVLKLLGEVAELRRTVDAQRDEIARLKGGPRRPNIKPKEKATEPKALPTAGGEPRQKGSKTSKLTIHEERTVKLKAPPQGSRFKGYTSYVVQDLMITPHVVKFRCERWQTANGETMTAPLPVGICGHFGPELRRFLLAQCHQAQVTVARLLALLQALGIIISKRQIVRLLIGGQDGFLDEARDVLRGGLFERQMDHGRRYWRAPQGQERLLHPDRKMRTLFGLAPQNQRAAATSSISCAPGMRIMSSMPRR
jgi:hypothetical protein